MRRDIDQVMAGLAQRQNGVFSRAQFLAAGGDASLLRRRIDAGLWTRVGAAAFRSTLAPLQWEGLLRASVWDAGARALVSHDAAAQMHGFPGFHDHQVHVLVPRAVDHVCQIATVHETRRFERVRSRLLREIPVVAPADTVVHLAMGMRRGRVAWLTEELLFSKRLSLEAITESLTRLGPGCRGLRPLRSVLTDYEPGEPIPESELERMFLQVAGRFELPPFERQAALPGRDQLPARVDFVWRDKRIIVEVDGRRWHARFADFDRDHRRDLYWLSLGYRTARVTWSMLVQDPGEVCSDLLAARLAG
ncbi:MAG TPA: type IV toxin-antitoxin system AbiEi family antitoxin domain-containing protein [Acidimicrobiales bacterium]|nr:type IV toxin-antitoxin system AbiEi family antitoxin domain-containing protein [Acidimicrobiales bacterium]